MLKVSVIGSGSWGTALANLLADKGIKTILYVRRRALYETILKNRENSLYLPGIRLSERLAVTNSKEEATAESDVVLLSIPVQYMRSSLEELRKFIRRKDQVFINTSKGIENNTLLLPSEIVCDVLKIDKSRVAVLSGPNFAVEVAKKLPTATVIAGENRHTVEKLQKLINCPYFRAYRSTDVTGVEVAGAVKNVMAIASGISDGLNLGNNAKASLITRGLAEIARFGVSLGAKRDTFMGLAGVGDLVLTCTGNLSRNRQVGLKIAAGTPLKEILSSMIMVAEGVNTVKSIYQWSNIHGVEMPISRCVYRVLYESKDPKEAVRELMERPLKDEFY